MKIELKMGYFERSLSNSEKQMIAKRTSAGLRYASDQGRVILGTVPFGYQLVDGEILVQPEEAELVLKIFNLIAEGYSCKKVSNLLNDEGNLNRKGLPWTAEKVRWIVKSETYLGELFYNKTSTRYFDNGTSISVDNPRSEWKRIEINPIVPSELFHIANIVLRIARKY
jgi:site-specific DNA recombinase